MRIARRLRGIIERTLRVRWRVGSQHPLTRRAVPIGRLLPARRIWVRRDTWSTVQEALQTLAEQVEATVVVVVAVTVAVVKGPNMAREGVNSLFKILQIN